MIAFIARRLSLALISIIGASVIAFVILRVAPGDPARLVLGQFATPAQLAEFRRANGLDLNLATQYWRFISHFVAGNWGFSYGSGVPVRHLLLSRLPATVELALAAFAWAAAAAVLLALACTYRSRPRLERSVNAVAFVGLAAPPFWLALLALLGLSLKLGLFPGPDGQINPNLAAFPHPTGFLLIDSLLAGRLDAFASAVSHLILPAFVLGLGVWAYLYRLLRANLLEVANEPFLMVVESKGIRRWTAFRRHALPNAGLPTLTAAGLVLAWLLGGSVLVEAVFDWPGVGTRVVEAVGQKDYAVVQAFIMLSAATYVAVNFLVDLLYGVVDPRIRSAVNYGVQQ